MYKKGAGNHKQGKDAGNRTLCPYRNFSQAIKDMVNHDNLYLTYGRISVVFFKKYFTWICDLDLSTFHLTASCDSCHA